MSAKLVMLLACLAFVGLGVSSIHAQTHAEILKTESCGLLNVDSDGKIIWPGTTVKGHAVQANNPAGNVLLKCQGRLPQGPSKQVTLDYSTVQAQIDLELPCPTPWGSTENWQQVITPSGQATLTCHINPSSR